jgi:hypothetical protein
LKKSPRFISVSGIHEVLVLLEDTLLRWKPRNSLTPEYLIFMGHSHSLGVFVSVCGHVDGCKIFPISMSAGTLFQIMQVSNASWKSLISGLPQHCYSKDDHNILSK